MDLLQKFLLVAPVLLFSIVAHEYAHGYAALKQGDPTAYNLGYVTWNPIKYVDPFLTILLPIITFFANNGVPFGGARSGPINSRNFRHYRRGDIIVSLAGVTANALIALAAFVLAFGLGFLGRLTPAIGSTVSLLQLMLVYAILINAGLVALNLIPLPPFDGSVLLKHILPPAWGTEYRRLTALGPIILILLFTVGRPIIGMWMAPAFSVANSAIRILVPHLLPSPWAS